MTKGNSGRPFRCLNQDFNCSPELGHIPQCLKIRQRLNFTKWYQKKLLIDPDYNRKEYKKRALAGELNIKEFGVGSGKYTRDPSGVYGRPQETENKKKKKNK